VAGSAVRFAYLGLLVLLIGSGAGDEQASRVSAEAAHVESMSNNDVHEESRSGSVMVGVGNRREEVDEPTSNDNENFESRSESITAALGYIDEELDGDNDGTTQKDVTSTMERQSSITYETALPSDDASYTNRFGLNCSQHELLQCNALQKIGYKLHDVEELLSKCPQSCALSLLSSTGYGEDEVGAITGGGANRFLRPKGTSVHSTTRNRKLSPVTTPDTAKPQDQPTCFDGKCQDEALYRSKLALPCKRFAVFDCSQFVSVGFTANETMELLDNCPCSCNAECWSSRASKVLPPSALPTATPSSVPTVSPQPTLTPLTFVIGGTTFGIRLVFMTAYMVVEDIAILDNAINEVVSAQIGSGESDSRAFELSTSVVSQGFTTSRWALDLRLSGAASVTLRNSAINRSGEYDASLVPVVKDLDGSIKSVFVEEQRKNRFIDFLRTSESQTFEHVADVDFVGFYTSPPTESPTQIPSPVPSPLPSRSPVTDAPTHLPSAGPTSSSPTRKSSPFPTLTPSDPPKVCESAGSRCGSADTLSCCPGDRCVLVPDVGGRCLYVKPTPSSSAAPSSLPSSAPYGSPSAEPSALPSSEPTNRPSPSPITNGPTSRPTSCIPPGDLCAIDDDATPCCVQNKCTQILGIGARCIYVDTFATDSPTSQPLSSPLSDKPSRATESSEPTTRSSRAPSTKEPSPGGSSVTRVSRSPAGYPTSKPVWTWEDVNTAILARRQPNKPESTLIDEESSGVDSRSENQENEGAFKPNQVIAEDVEEDKSSSWTKSEMSTSAVFIGVYVAVGVVCLALTAVAAYYVYLPERKKKRETDNVERREVDNHNVSSDGEETEYNVPDRVHRGARDRDRRFVVEMSDSFSLYAGRRKRDDRQRRNRWYCS